MANPLPKKRLILLCMATLPDALSVTIVIPFAPFMVQEMLNIPLSSSYRTGYYCGLIASFFACGSIFGSPIWGRICDTLGRRPVLLCGLFTNSLFLFLFGLSRTYFQAIILRFLHGMLTGNVTVSKTYLSDITDATNESAAFGMIGMTFGFGVVMGPLVGGYLSRPAIQYPSVFGSDSFFARYPYALPCMTVGTFAACSFVFSVIFLPESKPSMDLSEKDNEEENPVLLNNEENATSKEGVSIPIQIYGTFPGSTKGHSMDEMHSSFGETASRTSEASHDTSYHQETHEPEDWNNLEFQKYTDFDSSVYLSGSYNLKEGFFIHQPVHEVENNNTQRTFASQRLKRGQVSEIRSAFSRERPFEHYHLFSGENKQQRPIIPQTGRNLTEYPLSSGTHKTHRKTKSKHHLFFNSPSTSATSDISGFAAIMAMSSLREQPSTRADLRGMKDMPSVQEDNNERKWSDIQHSLTEKPQAQEEEADLDTKYEEFSKLTLRALITHLFFSNEKFSVVLRVALSISFTLNAMDEVLALWAVNDPSLGGVRFSTADLGVVQTMGGVSCIFSAVVFFQYIAAKIGVLNTMRLGLIVGLIFYPTPAYIATLGLTRSNRLTWILLIIGNIMTSFCGQCCHTALPLLVKNAAPPERLGEATGYTQGLQSLGFAAGPLVGSCVFAFILGASNLPQPFNKGRLYYMLGDTAVFFILRSTFLLPPWPWRTSVETNTED